MNHCYKTVPSPVGFFLHIIEQFSTQAGKFYWFSILTQYVLKRQHLPGVEKRCDCKESFLFSSFKNTSWLWRAWRICQNLLVWLREAASGNATQAAMFALLVSTVWNTLPSLHLDFQTSNYSYLTLSNGTCFSTELSFRYLMANEEHSGLKRTLM